MSFFLKQPSLWWVLAILATCSVFTDPLPTAYSQSQPSEFVAKAERGITGTYSLTYRGPALRTKIQRDTNAPLMVRLRKADKPDLYELRFIGTTEGVFDLRTVLEHANGLAAVDLPPLNVSIVSTLPKDHRSDLFEAAEFQPKLTGGYRVGLVAAIVSWLAIPLIAYAIRVLRRPAIATAPPTPLPVTLAEQLRPLVEAAASRTLSTPEKGQLELLLVHYWRERAELPELSMASSIQKLHSHAEAGPLLNAVENWLHRAEVQTNSPDKSPEAILRLLKPYQSVVAIASERMQTSKGSP